MLIAVMRGPVTSYVDNHILMGFDSNRMPESVYKAAAIDATETFAIITCGDGTDGTDDDDEDDDDDDDGDNDDDDVFHCTVTDGIAGKKLAMLFDGKGSTASMDCDRM